MKRFLTVFATLVVASSLVSAQGGRGGFRMGGPSMAVRDDVSAELKLTADQKTALQKIIEDMRAQNGGGRGGGGGGNGGGGQRMAEMEAKVKAVLNETQFRRYQELGLQQAGGNALSREDVQKALEMTDEQKSKITTLNESMREDMGDLRQSGVEREEMMAEMRKLREGYSKDMLKVLTAEQTKKWEAMLGKPFKFQDSPPTGS